MNSSGALVIFVKTPGLTPAKTRLASSIGQELANKFYELSIKATRALAKDVKNKMTDLKIYWAVAETEGLAAQIWSDFSTVSQGAGALGERLSHVYNTILEKHSFVCFIGADSPHISTNELLHAVSTTARRSRTSFVLGETLDGGFYFFGGATQLPSEAWKTVEYSSNKTSAQLKDALIRYGPIESLNTNFDIDIVEDLKKYSEMTWHNNNLLPEQLELIQWSRTSFAEMKV